MAGAACYSSARLTQCSTKNSRFTVAKALKRWGIFYVLVSALAWGAPTSEEIPTGHFCVVPLVRLSQAAPSETAGPKPNRSTIKPPFDFALAEEQLRAAGYTDLRLLGQGSHGAVFEAQKDGRDLAVKVPGTLLYGLLLPAEAAFFGILQRASAAARTQNPASPLGPRYFPEGEVVPLPASNGADATMVLVMKRVPTASDDATSAEPLIRRMSGPPLAPEVGRALTYHLPRALEQMHAAGVVHRDIKPSNVLLGRDLVPTIVDFGIAARVGRRPDQLVGPANSTSGTLAYMGPEQAVSEKATPKNDVFAAKKLLLEVLVGDDVAGLYTEKLQTHPDPAQQQDYPSARRWLRAPEDRIGRLGTLLVTHVVADGAELRRFVDMAEDRAVTDDAFYQELGGLLVREPPEVIVNELLYSKALIERFPDGLGIDTKTATRIREAFPVVARGHDIRRKQLLRDRQYSTVEDGNLFGYETELRARLGIPSPP